MLLLTAHAGLEQRRIATWAGVESSSGQTLYFPTEADDANYDWSSSTELPTYGIKMQRESLTISQF